MAFNGRFKVPRDGYEGCWGALASEALTSEALTMRMIRKEKPAIPLSTIHSFDASMNNEIHCPYILMDWLHDKPLWEAWHQNDISYSRQQQIRIKALETLAASMVELSEIRFEKAGGLQFDAGGNFVDIGKRKTPNT